MPLEKMSEGDVFKIIDEISKKLDCNFDLSLFKNKIFIKISNYIMILNNNDILDEIRDKANIVSAGLIFGIITKKFGILPFISVSNILVNNCKKKLILPNKLAEKLTYGKKIILREKIPDGFYIILNKEGDFIGIVKVEGNKKIIPILDIGWYLRKGG